MADQNLMFSEKDPVEKIVYGINFTNILNTDETISAACVTMSAYVGTDASASSLLIGSPAISGTTITQTVSGGTEGVTYRLRAQAGTSTGRILVGAAYIPVNAP